MTDRRAKKPPPEVLRWARQLRYMARYRRVARVPREQNLKLAALIVISDEPEETYHVLADLFLERHRRARIAQGLAEIPPEPLALSRIVRATRAYHRGYVGKPGRFNLRDVLRIMVRLPDPEAFVLFTIRRLARGREKLPPHFSLVFSEASRRIAVREIRGAMDERTQAHSRQAERVPVI